MPDRAVGIAPRRHPAITVSQTAIATDEAVIEADGLARRAVRAVMAGDRDAFAALVERDLPAVMRVCFRVLGNRDDAEETAQEAFLAAYRSLSTWRGDGPFTAWVSRIALRAALRRAARQRPVDWIDVGAVDGPGEVTDSAARRVARHLAGEAVEAADRTDPSRLAEAAEREAALREAVRALDEPYRETVALRYFADLTVPEIAEVCGRPQGTVKTHLHRGLLRLRQQLGSWEPGR